MSGSQTAGSINAHEVPQWLRPVAQPNPSLRRKERAGWLRVHPVVLAALGQVVGDEHKTFTSYEAVHQVAERVGNSRGFMAIEARFSETIDGQTVEGYLSMPVDDVHRVLGERAITLAGELADSNLAEGDGWRNDTAA